MIFRGNTHARTPVYFGEQWRRAVCVIRILIIKISHGFDRFSSLGNGLWAPPQVFSLFVEC